MKFNHAALSGSRALLWSEITSPATLNKCSDGTLVGGRPRYTRASLATSASRSLFCLHHANGFSIRPITGCDRYLCQLCFVGTSFLLIVNICGLNHIIQALPQNRCVPSSMVALAWHSVFQIPVLWSLWEHWWCPLFPSQWLKLKCCWWHWMTALHRLWRMSALLWWKTAWTLDLWEWQWYTVAVRVLQQNAHWPKPCFHCLVKVRPLASSKMTF